MLRKMVLANIDYKTHTTDEGWQLQEGLASCGWFLVGAGYGNGCRHVPTLLDRYQPDIVFVQDFRDWTPGIGAFRDDLVFQEIDCLSKAPCKTVTVCKDAGTLIDVQRSFADKIEPDAYVVYYHPTSVLRLSTWLSNYKLIRIYHSIDMVHCANKFWSSTKDKKCILTGAINPGVYPLRAFVSSLAASVGIDIRRHPGYGNQRTDTSDYLTDIAQYKLHFSTASRYGFALRKIVESLAVGCVPITDLPEYDTLPEIDCCLFRVPPMTHPRNYSRKSLIGILEAALDFYGTVDFEDVSPKTWQFYDWRESGRRLDRELTKLCT